MAISSIMGYAQNLPKENMEIAKALCNEYPSIKDNGATDGKYTLG